MSESQIDHAIASNLSDQELVRVLEEKVALGQITDPYILEFIKRYGWR